MYAGRVRQTHRGKHDEGDHNEVLNPLEGSNIKLKRKCAVKKPRDENFKETQSHNEMLKK